MRNQEWVSYRKKIMEEFPWGKSLFWLHAFLSMSFFVAFFVYSLPFPNWRTCWMVQYIILVWVVFCVIISWVNGQKCENLLQFNTSWLASLRTWYYFRLYFSFNRSDFDLTLIKKSHTKVLIKNKILQTRCW